MSEKTTVTFQMPKTLKAKADKAAKKKEVPLAMWFRDLIKNAVAKGKL